MYGFDALCCLVSIAYIHSVFVLDNKFSVSSHAQLVIQLRLLTRQYLGLFTLSLTVSSELLPQFPPHR